MARKAREILKARGYTDEELNGLTLLTDTRFAAALEAEDAERERLVTEHAKIQGDLEATTRWYHNEAVPALNKALTDATSARAERAKLEAQIKAEQDYGMRRVADQDRSGDRGDQGQGGDRGQGGQGNRDSGNRDSSNPDYTSLDQRYIGADTFKQAFAQTGEAIAMATDIMEDHRDLFGKRLPGGIGELRSKYHKATETGFRGTLRDYWEKEYDIPTRRTEISTKERDDHDNKIRQEERQKVMSEFANPMTRTPESSRSPFTRKVVNGGTSDGKQPWERGTVEQRRSERVVKFGTKVLTGNQAG